MKYSLRIMRLLLNLIMVLIICSCAKNSHEQKNKQLAQNYYKLCMLEFSDKTSEAALPEDVYKKALQHIDQAINYSCSAEYLAVKATLLFRLNDIDAACKTFERALNLDPEPNVKANILNNYACLLGQIGKSDKALRLFKEIESDNAYFTPQAAIFNQGLILFNMRDYKAAAQTFLRAIQKAPDFIDARYYLALSAFKNNDFVTAKNEVKTILFLEPEHECARWLKSKLESETRI